MTLARMTEIRIKLQELVALSPEWVRLNNELIRLGENKQMKFRAMAKHFIYEKAHANREVNAEDGKTFGENKDFTPKQIDKMQTAVEEELAKMKQKLLDKGIIG